MIGKTLLAIAFGLVVSLDADAAPKCAFATYPASVLNAASPQELLNASRESLEHYHRAVAQNKMKCAKHYTENMLPALQALADAEVEPRVKLATLPLVNAYADAISAEKNAIDAKVTEFYQAANEYTAATSKQNWKHYEHKDEMRGSTLHQWKVVSNNSKPLEWPYKEASVVLVVNQTERDGKYYEADALVRATDGQLSYYRSEDLFTAKFDDKKPSLFVGSRAEDTKYLFIKNQTTYGLAALYPDFLKELSASKKVIIGLNFYHNGEGQFKFDTAGLPVMRATGLTDLYYGKCYVDCDKE